MNYMEQVAKMLGVEIGEELRVVNDCYLYKLVDKGLYFLANDNKWKIDYLTLTRILNGKAMILKSPILDEAEKEYLSAVINPFRDRVISIGKCNCYEYEYIVIKYLDIGKNEGHIYLPCFEIGTMYKGMEAGKEYSLGDLRL